MNSAEFDKIRSYLIDLGYNLKYMTNKEVIALYDKVKGT